MPALALNDDELAVYLSDESQFILMKPFAFKLYFLNSRECIEYLIPALHFEITDILLRVYIVEAPGDGVVGVYRFEVGPNEDILDALVRLPFGFEHFIADDALVLAPPLDLVALEFTSIALSSLEVPKHAEPLHLLLTPEPEVAPFARVLVEPESLASGAIHVSAHVVAGSFRLLLVANASTTGSVIGVVEPCIALLVAGVAHHVD